MSFQFIFATTGVTAATPRKKVLLNDNLQDCAVPDPTEMEYNQEAFS